MLAWLLLPLASLAASAPTPPRGEAHYDVVVVAGIGDGRVEETRTVRTDRVARREWLLERTHTEGAWEEDGDIVRFDSDEPRPGTPWPVVTEHAVASVPVRVRFDREGTPAALVQPDAWRERADASLEALSLPAVGRRSGASFIDPVGRLTALGRVFVGTPASTWERSDVIAGVEVTRTETCEQTREGGVSTWTCRGTATSSERALQQVQTWTTLVVDRRGLLSIEEGWSGTLVHLAADGRTPTDSPIGGRRLVQRR